MSSDSLTEGQTLLTFTRVDNAVEAKRSETKLRQRDAAKIYYVLSDKTTPSP